MGHGVKPRTTSPGHAHGHGRAGGLIGVRRAEPGDVAALVRLRAVMFEDMGTAGGGWEGAAEAWFAARLGQPDVFAAFLAEDPELGVVSAASGICDLRPPGPSTLSPVRGYVFSVATDPRARGRGHARACLTALMAWFAEETAVELVELAATADGAALYESLGFRPREYPVMRATVAQAR